MPETETGTTIDEIADGIYRIGTPIPPGVVPGGFSFNQFLVLDDEPLLFHTGPHRLFPAVRAAIERVLPVERLQFVAYSHFEQDECGALNEFLAAAPRAEAVCSRVSAMTCAGDLAIRPPRALADGDRLALGRHEVVWLDAPHVPHGWDCGFLSETSTATLLCGDLFTQGGADHPPITERDLLGPSEAMRAGMDYGPTRRRRARRSRSSRAPARERSRACTGLPSEATGPRCSRRSPTPSGPESPQASFTTRISPDDMS